MLLDKYERYKKDGSLDGAGASPGVGPIAEKYKLRLQFGNAFTKNPKGQFPDRILPADNLQSNIKQRFCTFILAILELTLV